MLKHTIVVLLVVFSTSVNASWQAYEDLLKRYVKPGNIGQTNLTLVDYAGLKADGALRPVIDQIESTRIASLKTKEQRLAFYINAYNIYAMKMVVDHWPLKSIRDVGSFFSPVWKKTIGRINGKAVSLHIIEHEILRKMGEPRIHMAIVCASVSCPDLRTEAYRAEQLEQQLTDQTQAFLSNPHKGVTRKGAKLEVSKIFDWFEEDFDASGGVVAFIGQYRADVLSNAKRVDYLDYDWRLNQL